MDVKDTAENCGNLMALCQSQQVIRTQPSAETVYEKRGHTVNTDLQHSHSVPALAYISYLAN